MTENMIPKYIAVLDRQRERKDMSMRQVSLRSGWSHNAFYQLMQGQTSLEKFLDLCAVLDIRVELYDKTGRKLT